MDLNNDTTVTTTQQAWIKPTLSVISINDSTLGGLGDVSDGLGASKAS